MPDAVDTVCAPDDGWWYHPKHVEQFPDKINCVTFHLFGYIAEYTYDARTHNIKFADSRLLDVRLLTSGRVPCVHGVARGNFRSCVF